MWGQIPVYIDLNEWGKTQMKYNPKNERIKRKCFIFLKDAKAKVKLQSME